MASEKLNSILKRSDEAGELLDMDVHQHFRKPFVCETTKPSNKNTYRLPEEESKDEVRAPSNEPLNKNLYRLPESDFAAATPAVATPSAAFGAGIGMGAVYSGGGGSSASYGFGSGSGFSIGTGAAYSGGGGGGSGSRFW